MILIVGQRDDPHIASVVHSLSNCQCEFFVVDSFGEGSDGVQFHISNNVIFDIEGNRFRLHDIKSIWWRQKPRFVIPTDSMAQLYDYYFAHLEWNQLLDYLSFELSSKFNINDRRVSRRIHNKLLQLKYAEDAGFRVPSTLVSNNFDSVSQFIRGGDKKYVFKTLTPYMPPSGMITYTTIIDSQLIDERRDFIKAVPGIFQEFKEKLFELRVTVVGEDVYAARINSRHSQETAIDWRQEIFSDIYSVHILDHQVKSRLLALHKRFGLFYGAYDLIVDNEENYFFMEVNPSGQWMWLEEALGFPISESIAEALDRGRP